MTCQRHWCDQNNLYLEAKEEMLCHGKQFFSTEKCKRFWLSKGSTTYIIYNSHANIHRGWFLILKDSIILFTCGYKKRNDITFLSPHICKRPILHLWPQVFSHPISYQELDSFALKQPRNHVQHAKSSTYCAQFQIEFNFKKMEIFLPNAFLPAKVL